ncbi:MAG: hypothetical protein QOI80_1020 [Solirubrobacteraceae bacterium]|nr:hypothetical protein [Solirubrobacteraceae bacterium]
MQADGADLVVFYNAKLDVLRGQNLPDALHVLADPRRQVYKPLGTTRMSAVGLVTSQIGPGLKALAKGEVAKATRADMQRLGADVAVRADGEIALLHVATSPDDRADPADLIAAL